MCLGKSLFLGCSAAIALEAVAQASLQLSLLGLIKVFPLNALYILLHNYFNKVVQILIAILLHNYFNKVVQIPSANP